MKVISHDVEPNDLKGALIHLIQNEGTKEYYLEMFVRTPNGIIMVRFRQEEKQAHFLMDNGIKLSIVPASSF